MHTVTSSSLTGKSNCVLWCKLFVMQVSGSHLAILTDFKPLK